MAQTARRSLNVFALLAGFTLATSASAAPVGEISQSQDCFSKAAVQRTLDYARCTGLPLPLRDQCIIQTEQNYVAAAVACARKDGRTVVPKQNIDAPFMRRMRL